MEMQSLKEAQIWEYECCLLLDALIRNFFFTVHFEFTWEPNHPFFWVGGGLPGDISCFALSLIKPSLVECWPLGRPLCRFALSFSRRHMEGQRPELTLLSAFCIGTWKGRKKLTKFQVKSAANGRPYLGFFGPKLPCYLNKRTLALEGHAAFKSCDTFSSFSTR